MPPPRLVCACASENSCITRADTVLPAVFPSVASGRTHAAAHRGCSLQQQREAGLRGRGQPVHPHLPPTTPLRSHAPTTARRETTVRLEFSASLYPKRMAISIQAPKNGADISKRMTRALNRPAGGPGPSRCHGQASERHAGECRPARWRAAPLLALFLHSGRGHDSTTLEGW